ncbi:hypothetical protein [Plantactinospora soyae]|uniref:Ribosomal protein S27AE n=1 Tax=Plantactinospora soyae TaxID=1544732 RepID=A0A927M214_9ACTN|nr:hypothetical protein [Plantactinospora soyae]MBE1485226.1 ribosomal protein S27AE [Plantactinospora soyae]
MDISIQLPLDVDGFLRRECPHCEQQFKWHNGPANEEAEGHGPPPSYFCPHCGVPADHDSWWTHEQLDFIHGSASPAIMRSLQDELEQTFRRSKYISFKAEGDTPNVPVALVELDDMHIITSPCHAYEPIKVPDGSGPYHCLVCGSRFAV